MSETLSGQDLKSLQDMPNALEMGELRKMTTLQDISLKAEGEGAFQPSNDGDAKANEKQSKTNSLKRLFRLANKKKLEEEHSPPEGEKSQLGVEGAEGRKGLSGSFSKASLKSSLSSYWTSVFKPKKTGKSTTASLEMDSKDCEATSSINLENCSPSSAVSGVQDKAWTAKAMKALEEIQNLKISEECP